ncbi:hypothetical protein GM526_21750 [Enterococcus avium]|uniref:hypothetical protein n=1 Tax=Enterococcus avium TaxID=33945 RepID=UPI0012AC2496|nr:hypothetical protein [Enterococcus avium]MDU6621955.1 hypothetical protein [Enterococcus avium]NVN79668.1 hypothetical protein [Enterococcus avium]
MRSRKTPEQQAAWSELLLLINDPEWYLNPEKCKRHKILMDIIEYQEPIVLSTDEKHQRYLDNRPGLEVTVVKMLLEKKLSKEIRDELKMDFKVIAFCRRKYNLNPKIRTKKS